MLPSKDLFFFSTKDLTIYSYQRKSNQMIFQIQYICSCVTTTSVATWHERWHFKGARSCQWQWQRCPRSLTEHSHLSLLIPSQKQLQQPPSDGPLSASSLTQPTLTDFLLQSIIGTASPTTTKILKSSTSGSLHPRSCLDKLRTLNVMEWESLQEFGRNNEESDGTEGQQRRASKTDFQGWVYRAQREQKASAESDKLANGKLEQVVPNCICYTLLKRCLNIS